MGVTLQVATATPSSCLAFSVEIEKGFNGTTRCEHHGILVALISFLNTVKAGNLLSRSDHSQRMRGTINGV